MMLKSYYNINCQVDGGTGKVRLQLKKNRYPKGVSLIKKMKIMVECSNLIDKLF